MLKVFWQGSGSSGLFGGQGGALGSWDLGLGLRAQGGGWQTPVIGGVGLRVWAFVFGSSGFGFVSVGLGPSIRF